MVVLTWYDLQSWYPDLCRQLSALYNCLLYQLTVQIYNEDLYCKIIFWINGII